jgi:peroxiredoxin
MSVFRNTELPGGLPVPQDDGATRHLPGMKLPSLPLRATDGSMVDLASLKGRTVVYAYPRTGVPGQALPDGWDAIPGARGCTPQSCSFRDHFKDLQGAGAAERLHLPFAILSDEDLKFIRALNLPTFQAAGMELVKRLTLVIDDGVITHVLYPVFPPDQSASDTLAWLKANPR